VDELRAGGLHEERSCHVRHAAVAEEGCVSVRGLAFASAISSFTVFTGTDGCTDTRCGTDPASVTGAKSLTGS
jgi:hypothetical protein